MLKRLLILKPMRWGFHQLYGKEKGELMFLALGGTLGDLIERSLPENVKDALDRAEGHLEAVAILTEGNP